MSVEMKTDEFDFVEIPPKNLHCPLCNLVLRDPVVSGCGHTFCRSCIKPDRKCPLDESESLTALLSNLALNEQISELKVHCSNRSCGCPAILPIAESKNHEELCEFQRINCPISSSCPESFIRKDLEDHVTKFHQPGAEALSSQQAVCSCCNTEKMEQLLDRIESQTETIKHKEEEIGFLRSLVNKLNDRVDRLEQDMEHVSEISARTDLDVVDLRRDVDSLVRDVNRRVALSNVRIRKPSEAPLSGDKELKCLGTFVGHQGAVWTLSVIKDILLSGAEDGCVKIWENYECACVVDAHSSPVLATTSFHYKNHPYFVTASASGSLAAWSLIHDCEDLEVECIGEVDHAHSDRISSLAANPQESLIASGSKSSVKLWRFHPSAQSLTHRLDLADGTLPDSWVRGLIFNETRLYVACQKQLSIWDSKTGQCIKNVNVSQGTLHAIAYLPSIDVVICGSSEGEIQIRNGQNLEYIESLSGHKGTVESLCTFSPSSTLFLSGGQDSAIRVWDGGRGGVCLSEMIRHEQAITSIAVDQTYSIFSASLDSAIKLWSYQT